MRPDAGQRHRAALALMAASGFAGLGYQIVWTQQFAVWLGHESAAVLAVVTAFFGGLAVGAFALGRSIERSARPLRWYAACEAAIGAWSLVLALLMPAAGAWLVDRIGAEPSPLWQWGVGFGATFLLLLPATTAMGATLPAIERVAAGMQREGRSIAAYYASNTLGAVAGVLAAAFWLVPSFGLMATAGVCAALNFGCALAAGLVLAAPAGAPVLVDRTPASRVVLTKLALTGLLGIGYEVLVVRVLSQVAEDTVYTFAMLLAVYLVGSAAGAAAYQRWLQPHRDAAALGDRLLRALAIACLVGTASLWGAEQLRAALLESLGSSLVTGIGAEALLALLAFGLPTLAMGAVFSHLSVEAHAAGLGFGPALGANTLGAAAAPLLFGVLVAPRVGPAAALLGISIAYLALTRRSAWPHAATWAPAAAAAALLVAAPPLAFVDIPPGGRLLSYQDGVAAAVSVVEDADGVSRLRINNRQQEGSNASRRVDARQALLPLLLHPAPVRALFLGLGTGVTASSAALDPTLHVDAVELLPEVVAAARFFGPPEGDAAAQQNVITGDARRYVRASKLRYDVIVSDNFHPARSGSAALYTVEHFRAVRARLAAGGVFCQWLPLHQLDLVTLRSIVRSFIAVYPNGAALLANNGLDTPTLGLVGRAEDTARFDATTVRTRIATARLPNGAAEFGIDDEFALLGSFIAGPASLARFAGDAEPNTDDHPVVAYRAPRITYAADSLPRERLAALLRQWAIEPEALMAASTDPAWSRRLEAYASARNAFIEAGQQVHPSADPADMLAQVQAPLLAVLQKSPDFRPAYDPLLRLAIAMAPREPIASRRLLQNLAEVQPARTEAATALRELALAP